MFLLSIKVHSVIFCDKHKWMKAGMIQRWAAPDLPLTQTSNLPGCVYLHDQTLYRRQTSTKVQFGLLKTSSVMPHWMPVTLLLVIQPPREGATPPSSSEFTHQSKNRVIYGESCLQER